MTFQLSDWNLSEIRQHPTLPGRILAVVGVTMHETAPGGATHRLALKVWTDAAPDAKPADIEYALYAKAAEIARRTMAAADITGYRLAAE